MKPLNPRERSLVAIGLLVLAVAAAWFVFVTPLLEGFTDRAERREMLIETYVRNQRVLSGIPVWRTQLDEQKQTATKFAIFAPTEALAGEALKSRLNKMTTEVGGTISTIQDVQDGVPSGWVRVRADMQLTLAQLYKCLSRLESEEPYVVVESLSVAADRAFETGHLGPMVVRIEISAPIRISQSP
jgi:hypothetical protein